MDNVLNILQGILEAIGDFFQRPAGRYYGHIQRHRQHGTDIYCHRQMGVYLPCRFCVAQINFVLTAFEKSFGSVGISAFEYRGKPADHPLGKCDWQIEEL